MLYFFVQCISLAFTMVFGSFDSKNKDIQEACSQEDVEWNDDHDDPPGRPGRQHRHNYHGHFTTVSLQRHETTTRGPIQSTTGAVEDSGKMATSPQAVRNSVIAGWTAGVTGTLAGHPLDSLKVWVQTGIRPIGSSNNRNSISATTNSHGRPRPSSQGFFMSCVSTIRRFYSGVSGPVITVGLIQSINFAVYDTTRRFWYFHMDNPDADPYGPEQQAYLHQDSYTSVGVGGFTAGAVLSGLTSPILMIKTLQQTQPNIGFKDALKMIRCHPVAGFGVHFVVETLNRSVYFCTYEYLKRYIHYFEKQQQDESPAPYLSQQHVDVDGDVDGHEISRISLSGRMISAAAAGINCWAWLYPIDALRSRIYANMATHDVPMSGLAMAKIMYAQGGWQSFYRGFAVTTLRAGPVAAAILPVYDYVLDKLNHAQS